MEHIDDIAAQRATPGIWLFVVAWALACVGIVSTFSAASGLGRLPYTALAKQLLALLLGLCLLLALSRVRCHKLKKAAIPFLFLSFAMLVLVLCFGVRAGGARSWFRLGPLSFQPSEVAKLALVLYLGSAISRRQVELCRFWSAYLRTLLAAAILILPIALQPDLGTTLIMASVTLVMLFVGGAAMRHLVITVLAAIPLAVLAVLRHDYIRRRLLCFWRPEVDPLGAGYHILQGKTALGSGGLTGLGLGQGIHKLHFLPTPHTDSIFCVIGEELGFAGTAAVLCLFVALLWRGATLALAMKDPFCRQVTFGLTALLVSQAGLNIGVALGLLPPTGVTLPFISAGGSSLTVSMAAIGLILGAAREDSAQGRSSG